MAEKQGEQTPQINKNQKQLDYIFKSFQKHKTQEK